jgi:hypothetical protein
MSAVSANSLQGYLAVFAQESLAQYIAGMPKINLFTKNFDTEIANGGISVTTRISNTQWGSPNDLTNGWADTAASSSAVTATLKLRDYDVVFNELEWSTITPQVLQNTYLPQMVKQLANGIVVDAISNITSASFTNGITVGSSSLFTVTGSTSVQQAATTLSNLEIPEDGRYGIVSPNTYQSLLAGILPTYIYGDANAVKQNKVQELIGFNLEKYARFYGATKPQGGSSYSNGTNKLIGMFGHEGGLVCAVRAPQEINNGLVQSATAVDPTSGLSLQVRWVYDVSLPAWRMAVVSIYGTAAGNTSAIVPVWSTSGV